MVHGVSPRDYERVVNLAAEGFGVNSQPLDERKLTA
jgi:hypothetical protein